MKSRLRERVSDPWPLVRRQQLKLEAAPMSLVGAKLRCVFRLELV